MVKLPPTPAVLDLFKRIGYSLTSQLDPPRNLQLVLPAWSWSPPTAAKTSANPWNIFVPALKQLAEIYQDGIRIVYPVHLNPNVQEPVYRILREYSNIILLDPLDYLPMVQLMRHASLVLTDSGGLQEEAPAFGVPVLVMRQVTERPEGVQAGTVRLVGTDPDEIVSQARRLLDDPQAYAAMAHAVNPYGDGKAARASSMPSWHAGA